MIIPADVREKARAAYWNAVGGYDKVPPIEDTPCTTDAINASNQLIWNAAVEACAKVTCDWCLGSWALNDKGDFHPEANAKCEAWAIRAMSQEG